MALTLVRANTIAMYQRYALLTLVLLTVLAECQAQVPAQTRHGKEYLKQQKRAERSAWVHDTTKWDRMPLWSIGALVGKGANGPGVPADSISHADSRSRATYRVEATRRLRKGWVVGAHWEHRILRSAGLAHAAWISGYSSGWLGEGHSTYNADILTVQHRVNTLGLMTGYYNAPFPRRKAKVGYTLAMAGGLAVHLATASYGVEPNTNVTVRNGLFEPDHHDVLNRWSGRDEFARETAVGLSAQFDLRAELWFGEHVSFLLPMLGFTLPLVQPHFSGAGDDSSGVAVLAHELNLVSATIGAGLVVHF